MATLEELRRRLDSAHQMQSVVKTMKTIAAVTIRQFEAAVESLRDYNRAVVMGLQILLRNHPESLARARPGRPERLGAVVFGSDQGMCGQFNQVIADHALATMRDLGVERDQRLVVTIGERAMASLQAARQPIRETHPVAGLPSEITPIVQRILLTIERWRETEALDHVMVFHNRPLSGSSYEPVDQLLLPPDFNWLRALAAETWPSRTLPIFTMDPEPLFSDLIREYLFVSLYRACAESEAAENASRIASMQAAEKNIGERLDDLTMAYRQERQREITEELFDIVAGFEALTKS